MTHQIAALPMYDWPEVRAATDAQWTRIRHVLRESGIDAPDALTRETGDLYDFWRRPDILFAQTCWGPMGDGLAECVHVIGQPDYSDVEGGEGEFYRSVVLMRSDDETSRSVTSPSVLERLPSITSRQEAIRNRRFAYNVPDSMSGYLALKADLGSLDLFREQIPTGGHRASIRAVAANRADICAIDCRSWALAQCHEPAAAELVPSGWTSPRKGLPYITSRQTPPETVSAMRSALMDAGLIVG
ncbi:PhnD/SsuA/transferrin family substrate-binding protein [Mesorhizobium sp. YIM 152430]|uniref:phosphate/phosphite/phosphonate ABC transporter substrate-binding protein n=1 Tax=Mesorhizobium sp. YIM 152430 TaxID=3031761 RepID=UPI0023DBF767|nr:PhnD/SsuA/transferrin family substrate-binding protein [Mesorhizobium sp. YIM 152430]MDF1599752.1 PhnD/SsuA/transferrin family substrate-binding protein [Mesorhizobium sp. YIM 152430]